MARPSLRLERTAATATVTQLELFFDLVFVFALTQVTAMMADDLTGRGLLRGVFLIGLLWWCWIGYAWIGNVVRADEGGVRMILLLAMAAMFVLALTLPEAFTDLPGGLYGPVVVAVCYFLFRSLHLILFWIISHDDDELRRQIIRFAPSMLAGTTLLLVASQFEGAVQTWLWAAALVADYLGTWLGGARGWRLPSPTHFAERHGLILIVALGESIVAIGVGVAHEPISWAVIAASALGLGLSAWLWWIYFDVTARQAEHALASEPEATRPRLARDAYTFWHAPMILGIVLLALGLKKVLEYVADSTHHELSDPLSTLALAALFAGPACYLFGNLGFKWMIARVIFWPRVITLLVVVAAAPLAAQLPALAALAVLTAIIAALVVFEAIRYAEYRYQIRHAPHEAAPHETGGHESDDADPGFRWPPHPSTKPAERPDTR